MLKKVEEKMYQIIKNSCLWMAGILETLVFHFSCFFFFLHFYPDRNVLQSFAVFSAVAPREEKLGGRGWL